MTDLLRGHARGSAATGEKEVRENLEFNKSLRWTRSCPRTGGVLHAGSEYTAGGVRLGVGYLQQAVNRWLPGARKVYTAEIAEKPPRRTQRNAVAFLSVLRSFFFAISAIKVFCSFRIALPEVTQDSQSVRTLRSP